jgi:hypothetical protein
MARLPQFCRKLLNILAPPSKIFCFEVVEKQLMFKCERVVP